MNLFKNMTKEEKEKAEYGLIAVLSVLAYLFLMWLLTGNGPFTHNTYNSYALQAEAWSSGRLDLQENYSYLELAEYNGKIYVSFPPFPSYLLLPLTFVFGVETPDALLLWTANILIVIFLYKLSLMFKASPQSALLLSLFAFLGSNVTFTMLTPWVWFWAQMLCFLFSLMSIYYAFQGKGGLALAFCACGVGCRPMQVVFGPVILYILYYQISRADSDITFGGIIKQKIKWLIAPCIIGCSYMILNFLRFDNPFEFGHDYLPEHLYSEHGQFSTVYIPENIRRLFRLPSLDQYSRMDINHFGNLNFMIVSPIVVLALVSVVILLVLKEYKTAGRCACVILFCMLYLVITMMHNTMGGWGFGNRYANDILPWIYLVTLSGARSCPRMVRFAIPLFVFSICMNAVGIVVVLNNMQIA